LFRLEWVVLVKHIDQTKQSHRREEGKIVNNNDVYLYCL